MNTQPEMNIDDLFTAEEQEDRFTAWQRIMSQKPRITSIAKEP